ncbi:hypothetical protein KIPB_017273, partial [Kipferlia bialata]
IPLDTHLATVSLTSFVSTLPDTLKGVTQRNKATQKGQKDQLTALTGWVSNLCETLLHNCRGVQVGCV